MAAVTSAVVGAGAVLYSQKQQAEAGIGAGYDAARAEDEAAKLLLKSGSAADAEIMQAELDAANLAGKAAQAAEGRLSQFGGTGAFNAAQQSILGGEDLTSPLARSIISAGNSAQDPRFANISGPVADAARRESVMFSSGQLQRFADPLLQAGQEELAVAGDIAGIRQRGYGAQSSLARQAGTARANVLTGQTPQLQSILQGGNEARLLAGLAGKQQTTNQAQTLAELFGNLRGQGYLGG